ncbi:olfactory receptor class A-like protein 1 [Spea bombifrons]|uniref:olfactory receptor class A-like protein 1 n=1 Tax=Spea bombifrons TaxID=233779 RepID=UPI00234A6028|nr:olfactory receptor class A-like protein 1 [Spea bombifrons]
MDLHLLFKAIGFILLLVIGVPGNIFIIAQFTCFRIIEKKLLPANIILLVLSIVNLLVLLSRVIPQSLEAIGMENLLSDVECKLVIYTYRVSRAMSISVTSLLSCYQCLLITPRSGLCTYLKKIVTHNISILILILWIINIIMYTYSMSISRAKGNFTTSPYTLHVVYCNIDFLNYFTYILNGAFFTNRDFIFIGLMTLASGYIVYLLISHEKSIKGIRRSDRHKGRSVEYKASRAVILLVCLYVLLFGLDNAMWIYTLTMSNVSPNMNDARILLACSYSALSPLIIITSNPKLQQSMKWSQKNMMIHSQTSQNNTGDAKRVHYIS